MSTAPKRAFSYIKPSSLMKSWNGQILLYSCEFKLPTMAATATPSLRIAAANLCVSASRKLFKPSPTSFGLNRGRSAAELKSLCLMSATKLPSQRFHSNPLKTQRMVTRAMSSSSDKEHLPGLPIDLRGSCRMCETGFWYY
ncbi:unnamed protein product [Cuscuta campestris]|uniref:Uncharacterized protein n=1 Tax=Cuscuta campestris TaxID=132261 RepID=A0A484MXD8_9ASTE|nr:unnamed protein product [Cuscuta campestris]